MPVLARSVAVVLLAPLLSACAACSSAPPSADARPASATAAAPTVPAAPDASLDGEYRTVEVATVGWDEATTSPVVLLRQLDTGQLVPIWVGVAEAQAIAAALHEVRYPRPMTHDLTVDLIGRLHGHLDELLIHDVVDGTYYGLLRISVAGGDPLLVDSRPSDGLALALRAGAAIRVAQKILDETPDVDFLAPDEPEQVVRALGLTVVARTPELDAELGLPADRRGLVVLRAIGAAAERGMRRGDLVLEVAGIEMRRPVDLLDALAGVPYGDPVTVRYWRDGEEGTVELAPQPPGETAPVEASGKVA